MSLLRRLPLKLQLLDFSEPGEVGTLLIGKDNAANLLNKNAGVKWRSRGGL